MWALLGTIIIIVALIALGPIGWIILGILLIFNQAAKDGNKNKQEQNNNDEPQD